MKLPPDRGREHGYIKNILLGLDAGAIGTWWGIDIREPISSWCWRKRPDSWLRKLIDRVFLLLGDKDHCRISAKNHLKNRNQTEATDAGK